MKCEQKSYSQQGLLYYYKMSGQYLASTACQTTGRTVQKTSAPSW